MAEIVKDFAEAGDVVRFLDCNGYPSELIGARAVFTPGDLLVVRNCDIQNWSSSYAFEGHEGRFNTVMFRHVPGATASDAALSKASAVRSGVDHG